MSGTDSSVYSSFPFQEEVSKGARHSGTGRLPELHMPGPPRRPYIHDVTVLVDCRLWGWQTESGTFQAYQSGDS